MIEGKKYRIVYAIPGIHRTTKEAVLKFIGQDEANLHFSGRPEYGTQSINRDHVSQIFETNPDTPCYIGRRFFPETRLR